MLGFLRVLILLPVAIAVILLAIANRAPVTFSFDPFTKGAPELAVSVPLFILLFAAVALGIAVGGIGSWLGAARKRQSGRAARREVTRLKAEADRLRSAVKATHRPALPAVSPTG